MPDNHSTHPYTESSEVEDLRREVNYLLELVEQTASRLLTIDAQAAAVRQELEQKRRGFHLMAELAVTLGQDADFERVFISVSRRINSTLGMQRTAVLFPDGDGYFKSVVLQGYPREERRIIEARRIAAPADLLDPLHPVIVTGADAAGRFESLRRDLALPYFIASPVMLQNKVSALLVTGRLQEQRPYFPRLGESDVETVQTVGAYLAAMLAGYRLRQAESLARHDPLTGLLNQRGVTGQMRAVLALAKRGGFHFATLFFDLDGFKDVNDAHGHAAGDVVLRAVGERLRTNIRESDLVARIGGDEFLVVISHIRGPDDAAFVARKLLEKVNEPVNIGDAFCAVGASVGIAIFPGDGDAEDALVHAADEAMYQAKMAGKNTFAFAQAGGGEMGA